MKNDVVTKFLKRVFYRNYWFYRNILKESDSFMQYYYAAFAFSMFITFYITGLILFIGRITELEIFQWERVRFTVFAFVVIILNMIYFFNNKAKLEKEIKKKSKINLQDIIVLMYIICSFIVFFYNLYSVNK